MVADFFTKPLQGSKFHRFRAFVLGLPDIQAPIAPTIRKECVGANRPPVRSAEKDATTRVCDDERGVATSWADVVRKKKPSRLVGKQSDVMLTLFTKSKVVN